MSREYDSELQSRLSRFLKGGGISQSKAAGLIGLSQTALSQWRNSRYDNGDVAECERKIREYLDAEDEKAQNGERTADYRPINGYIPTSVSEDVYKLIRYCQLEKGMVVIHGDAGIGKTKAAEKFAVDYPTSTIYITVTPSSASLKCVLQLIAKALHMEPVSNNFSLMQDIRAKLDGTNRVLIIDEAQHLKIAALEEIRSLSDRNAITGEDGCGVVLIGNTEVYSRMLGKQEARFAQLFSRIKMNRYYSTAKVLKEDCKKLFPLLADSKEIDFLYGIQLCYKPKTDRQGSHWY